MFEMSTSLYYSATRTTPLTAEEQQQIAEWIETYSLENAKEDFDTVSEEEWEAFTVYNPTDPMQSDVIFEGATRLPDGSPEAKTDRPCLQQSAARSDPFCSSASIHYDLSRTSSRRTATSFSVDSTTLWGFFIPKSSKVTVVVPDSRSCPLL